MSIPAFNFPMDLDVIGCSDIFARAHSRGLERLPQTWRLRSFTDPDESKLRAFGEQFHVTELYTSTSEMLANTTGGSVLNTTPPDAHAEVSIQAMEAGRDVLCEKPMAFNLQQCDAMVEAARKTDRVLHLCFMSRYAPCWMKIRELVQNKSIGTVISATMTQYWKDGNFLAHNWRTDAAVSGGGIIADSASHWIDIFRWLFGEISSLTAAGIPSPASPNQSIDDSSFVLFRFQQGMLGMLRNSWQHLRPANEAETIEIYGTEGTILGNLKTPWLNGGVQSVRLVKLGNTTEWNFNDPMERFKNQLETFAELVRNHDTEHASMLDGQRVMQLQQTIYRAMEKHSWEEI